MRYHLASFLLWFQLYSVNNLKPNFLLDFGASIRNSQQTFSHDFCGVILRRSCLRLLFSK
nr:MAG TPA: hypothetical protein [Caudoviricetes sp.]